MINSHHPRRSYTNRRKHKKLHMFLTLHPCYIFLGEARMARGIEAKTNRDHRIDLSDRNSSPSGLTRHSKSLLSPWNAPSNHRVADELQIPYTCNGNRVSSLFFSPSSPPPFSLFVSLFGRRAHAYRSADAKTRKTPSTRDHRRETAEAKP